MDKKRIESLLNQIVAAANAVTVSGEQNMAQLMGICRSAREVWALVKAPSVSCADSSPRTGEPSNRNETGGEG